MSVNRREFLKGSAWLGLAAAAVGCSSTKGFGFGAGGAMAAYHDKPCGRLKIGIIGLGRGSAAFSFSAIPGCEITAICDLNAVRIEHAKKAISEKGQKTVPRVYTGGSEEWKRLCDDPAVDLVYNATPWELHVPIALYAMRAGKHVATEVPSAFTVDQCWELVETSERLQRHCMQLENCCYGEAEMLALNACRQGVFGEIVHAEGGYIHDLRDYCHGTWDDATAGSKDTQWAYWDFWRYRHNLIHQGNQYTTHGLGPICWYMNINRGDRFDYLTSLESAQHGFENYARTHFAADDWRVKNRVAMGDVNTMMIKTKLGRSILIQHDVSSARPYTRINRLVGTMGTLDGGFDGDPREGWQTRVALAKKLGESAHYFMSDVELAEFREKYKHPLWRQAGDIAVKTGGHGGMDFLMVLRLAYCLRMGLPLDQNVYDLASWCCLSELSEKSVRSRSCALDVPDFTRGAWRDTKPLGDLSVDMSQLGLRVG